MWLAKEQFENIEDLPQELKEQQKRGLTIRFCDDLRSHKKYYYVLQENPNDIVAIYGVVIGSLIFILFLVVNSISEKKARGIALHYVKEIFYKR